MTQRIFDIENEKDMQDLWDILPDDIIKITPSKASNFFYGWYNGGNIAIYTLKINWHDKTEITRPIQEATEADVEKICAFWDIDIEHPNYGLFLFKTKDGLYVGKDMSFRYKHCRRLTKQEIEELC